MIAQEHEFGFVFVSVVNQEFIALGDDRNIATHSLHKKANPVDHAVEKLEAVDARIKPKIQYVFTAIPLQIASFSHRVVKSMKYSSRSVQNNEV